MPNKSLDDIDRRLIALLRRNARQPLVAIARELGLSRTATQERMKRLERDGVLLGYTAKLCAPDERDVRAWLSVVLAPGKSCVDLTPDLLMRPEVRVCHSIAGPIDLVALVHVSSTEALGAFREALAAHPAVAQVSTAAVLASHLERE